MIATATGARLLSETELEIEVRLGDADRRYVVVRQEAEPVAVLHFDEAFNMDLAGNNEANQRIWQLAREMFHGNDVAFPYPLISD